MIAESVGPSKLDNTVKSFVVYKLVSIRPQLILCSIKSRCRFYDISNLIDFLTAEVIIDNKRKQQDTASGDLLADKLSLVSVQLQNQQNVDEQSIDHKNEIPLGKTDVYSVQ